MSSPSLSCYAIKPPDATWCKMQAAYDACRAANIEIPSALYDYFGHEEPDELGVKLDLKCYARPPVRHAAVEEYLGSDESGYNIHLDRLPKDVKIIRVVLS